MKLQECTSQERLRRELQKKPIENYVRSETQSSRDNKDNNLVWGVSLSFNDICHLWNM